MWDINVEVIVCVYSVIVVNMKVYLLRFEVKVIFNFDVIMDFVEEMYLNIYCYLFFYKYYILVCDWGSLIFFFYVLYKSC